MDSLGLLTLSTDMYLHTHTTQPYKCTTHVHVTQSSLNCPQNKFFVHEFKIESECNEEGHFYRKIEWKIKGYCTV